MIQLLIDNPLLLLFVVAALGYPLGRIKIGSFSLGVAAVLFVGLAIGALDPNLKLPSFVYLFGLAIFIYTIGLASGPGFFASFRRQGLRDNIFILLMILFATALAVGAYVLFNLKPGLTAGMFTGSLTNTPALAGLLDYIKDNVPANLVEIMQAEPVVAYSIAYPVGVIGVIFSIYLFQRLWKVDYRQEAKELRDLGASGEHLSNLTIRVTRDDLTGTTIDTLRQEQNWHIIFGRYKRGEEMGLVHGDMTLAAGDLVSLIGDEDDIARALAYLGEESHEHLEFDRSQLDFRRIFVSNLAVVGKPLAELKLSQRFGALITRVRRGDIDLLPSGDMKLELGDRVRVVAQRQRMPKVNEFFGDSYRSLSEIDIMTFGLGMALGLLIGEIPFPLPGGGVFKLGLAGGPLLVALVLGALGRTGPIVWQLPYSANLTLRQIGLILFLAGVGTRSGYAFASTFSQGGGIYIFLAGAVMTIATAMLTLFIGYKLLRIPMSLLIGMLAGLQTQPAVLGYANEQTGNDLANIGYATVYPLATISKILLAQLLLTLL